MSRKVTIAILTVLSAALAACASPTSPKVCQPGVTVGPNC
jgi:hypothetical protein